jgi:serine/threonine protein kinase
MAKEHVSELDIEGLVDPVEIGEGGFATVFKATQPAFGRTVAVKVLATLSLDDAARERFERECRSMGSLSEHPNIVTVYGAGFTESGRPYLLMAYLPGGSLQERIDSEGPLPWEEATLYGVHLAGALETAHRASIVHRDIKPGNVLMSSFGDAELTDFGIARIAGGHETRSALVTASFAHAPPEVIDGQKPAVAGDVYSLGSTMYELIAGSPAFESPEDESLVPMLRRVLSDPPPDLRERGVPDEVAAVIEKAMAKKPEDRQISAVELGKELQEARRSLGLDPGRLTVPTESAVRLNADNDIEFVDSSNRADRAAATLAAKAKATAVLDTAPAIAAEAAPSSSRKGVLIGAAAVVVVLVIAGIAFALVSRSSSTTAGGAGTATTVTPTTEATDYTPAMETDFIAACVKRDAAPATSAVTPTDRTPFCRCVIKRIKQDIPYARYVQLADEAARTGKVGPEVQAIQEECTASVATTTTTAVAAP